MTRAQTLIKDFGFHHFGFTPLETPMSFTFYRQWIEESHHGSMTFLENHMATKADPRSLWPLARSAIVVAIPYMPHPEPVSLPFQNATISLYARGRDYHHWLSERMEQLIEKFKAEYPEDFFLAATDSKPLLERDLARRAGLGWIGKNTCLIHEKEGSLFFLGEILTSLSLPSPEVLAPDRCGTCNRCLEACPTGALVQPRVLDARRCISYLTIEAKDDPPSSLRNGIGSWLFGCDICQTVCPWNEKAFGLKSRPMEPFDRNGLIEEMRWVLTSSGKAIQRRLAGTALLRAGPHKLKRSALIVAANNELIELLPEIRNIHLSSERLRPLAEWALNALTSVQAGSTQFSSLASDSPR